MAQSIRLEIDPEDYEKVKKQLTELYEIADRASFKIMIAAQQGVHPTAFGGWTAVAFLIGVLVGVLAVRLGGG